MAVDVTHIGQLADTIVSVVGFDKAKALVAACAKTLAYANNPSFRDTIIFLDQEFGNRSVNQENLMIPKIIAYHPEIPVKASDGKRHLIKLDLPDFIPDDEVLKTVAKALKVETVGEIVDTLKAQGCGDLKKQGLFACRLEDDKGKKTGQKEWNSDEKVA